MRLQKRNKIIETLKGISFSVIGLVLFSLYQFEPGILGTSAVGTAFFMTIVLTLAPLISFNLSSLSGLEHWLNLFCMIGFATSFYFLIRYLASPYQRFGVAALFSMQLFYGVKFASLIY
jgi:hypothetical protein